VIATLDVTRSSAPALIAPLGQITRFVTDGPVPAELCAALRRSAVAMHSPSANTGT
jgi:hypothetical protein